MIENRQFFFSKFFVYNKSVEQTRVELRFRSNLPFNSGPSFSIMMKGDHSITINVVSNEDRGSSSSQAGGTVELLPRLMLLPSFSYFFLSLSLSPFLYSPSKTNFVDTFGIWKNSNVFISFNSRSTVQPSASFNHLVAEVKSCSDSGTES